jgi:riboflavin synthase
LFTGIIEEVGTIREVSPGRMVFSCKLVTQDTRNGDSIAVNGCDLTAYEIDEKGFTASVMEETYKRTNLGELKAGDRVNLERALTLSGRLGGHLLRGVIEHTGEVMSYDRQELSVIARFKAPPEILRYVIVKGPIAVSGVSLTVIDRDDISFSVGLIPYTQDQTNLLGLKPGDKVNLESDIVARYVEQLLEARALEGLADQKG